MIADNYFFQFIFITLFMVQSSARIFQTSMKLSNFAINRGWIFLDKMSFAPGLGIVKLKTTFKGIPYGKDGILTLHAVPESSWQKQLRKKCENDIIQPFVNHRAVVNSDINNLETSKFFNIEETTLYYFVLKDCKQNLKTQYDNNNLEMVVELHLLNNGKQIGEEQDHWYIIPVILASGVWLVYFYTKNMKNINIKSQLHKFLIFLGTSTQISSLTWRTFGYLIYLYTGNDYALFHVIYLFMHSLSQSVVIGLIVMIGFGWTINFTTSQNWNIYLPIVAIFSLANGILMLTSKFVSNSQDRHHMFDNINGQIVITYRLLFAVAFIYGVIRTYASSKAKTKRFIAWFGVVGVLYIGALPIIVVIGNNYIPTKDRHQFVFVAIETLKCVTNIIMSLLLNIQSSPYSKISYQNRTFLPEQSKYF